MTPKTMTVYVVIPDNDRQKSVSRITVRTTPVDDKWLAGPERDCSVIHADLSLKAARKIAAWYEEHKDDGPADTEPWCTGMEPQDG